MADGRPRLGCRVRAARSARPAPARAAARAAGRAPSGCWPWRSRSRCSAGASRVATSAALSRELAALEASSPAPGRGSRPRSAARAGAQPRRVPGRRRRRVRRAARRARGAGRSGSRAGRWRAADRQSGRPRTLTRSRDGSHGAERAAMPAPRLNSRAFLPIGEASPGLLPRVPQGAQHAGRLAGLFSSDLAIDLGTANTLVYAQGQGPDLLGAERRRRGQGPERARREGARRRSRGEGDAGPHARPESARCARSRTA